MKHQHLVANLADLGNLASDEPGGLGRFEQRSRDLDHNPQSRPSSSAKPSIRFMFWMAWPAAPLPRLSRHETTTRRFPAASRAKPRSQKFVSTTYCSSGNRPPASTRTIGLPEEEEGEKRPPSRRLPGFPV